MDEPDNQPRTFLRYLVKERRFVRVRQRRSSDGHPRKIKEEPPETCSDGQPRQIREEPLETCTGETSKTANIHQQHNSDGCSIPIKEEPAETCAEDVSRTLTVHQKNNSDGVPRKVEPSDNSHDKTFRAVNRHHRRNSDGKSRNNELSVSCTDDTSRKTIQRRNSDEHLAKVEKLSESCPDDTIVTDNDHQRLNSDGHRKKEEIPSETDFVETVRTVTVSQRRNSDGKHRNAKVSGICTNGTSRTVGSHQQLNSDGRSKKEEISSETAFVETVRTVTVNQRRKSDGKHRNAKLSESCTNDTSRTFNSNHRRNSDGHSKKEVRSDTASAETFKTVTVHQLHKSDGQHKIVKQPESGTGDSSRKTIQRRNSDEHLAKVEKLSESCPDDNIVTDNDHQRLNSDGHRKKEEIPSETDFVETVRTVTVSQRRNSDGKHRNAKVSGICTNGTFRTVGSHQQLNSNGRSKKEAISSETAFVETVRTVTVNQRRKSDEKHRNAKLSESCTNDTSRTFNSNHRRNSDGHSKNEVRSDTASAETFKTVTDHQLHKSDGQHKIVKQPESGTGDSFASVQVHQQRNSDEHPKKRKDAHHASSTSDKFLKSKMSAKEANKASSARKDTDVARTTPVANIDTKNALSLHDKKDNNENNCETASSKLLCGHSESKSITVTTDSRAKAGERSHRKKSSGDLKSTKSDTSHHSSCSSRKELSLSKEKNVEAAKTPSLELKLPCVSNSASGKRHSVHAAKPADKEHSHTSKNAKSGIRDENEKLTHSQKHPESGLKCDQRHHKPKEDSSKESERNVVSKSRHHSREKVDDTRPVNRTKIHENISKSKDSGQSFIERTGRDENVPASKIDKEKVQSEKNSIQEKKNLHKRKPVIDVKRHQDDNTVSHEHHKNYTPEDSMLEEPMSKICRKLIVENADWSSAKDIKPTDQRSDSQINNHTQKSDSKSRNVCPIGTDASTPDTHKNNEMQTGVTDKQSVTGEKQLGHFVDAEQKWFNYTIPDLQTSTKHKKKKHDSSCGTASSHRGRDFHKKHVSSGRIKKKRPSAFRVFLTLLVNAVSPVLSSKEIKKRTAVVSKSASVEHPRLLSRQESLSCAQDQLVKGGKTVFEENHPSKINDSLKEHHTASSASSTGCEYNDDATSKGYCTLNGAKLQEEDSPSVSLCVDSSTKSKALVDSNVYRMEATNEQPLNLTVLKRKKKFDADHHEDMVSLHTSAVPDEIDVPHEQKDRTASLSSGPEVDRMNSYEWISSNENSQNSGQSGSNSSPTYYVNEIRHFNEPPKCDTLNQDCTNSSSDLLAESMCIPTVEESSTDPTYIKHGQRVNSYRESFEWISDEGSRASTSSPVLSKEEERELKNMFPDKSLGNLLPLARKAVSEYEEKKLKKLFVLEAKETAASLTRPRRDVKPLNGKEKDQVFVSNNDLAENEIKTVVEEVSKKKQPVKHHIRCKDSVMTTKEHSTDDEDDDDDDLRSYLFNSMDASNSSNLYNNPDGTQSPRTSDSGCFQGKSDSEGSQDYTDMSYSHNKPENNCHHDVTTTNMIKKEVSNSVYSKVKPEDDFVEEQADSEKEMRECPGENFEDNIELATNSMNVPSENSSLQTNLEVPQQQVDRRLKMTDDSCVPEVDGNLVIKTEPDDEIDITRNIKVEPPDDMESAANAAESLPSATAVSNLVVKVETLNENPTKYDSKERESDVESSVDSFPLLNNIKKEKNLVASCSEHQPTATKEAEMHLEKCESMPMETYPESHSASLLDDEDNTGFRKLSGTLCDEQSFLTAKEHLHQTGPESDHSKKSNNQSTSTSSKKSLHQPSSSSAKKIHSSKHNHTHTERLQSLTSMQDSLSKGRSSFKSTNKNSTSVNEQQQHCPQESHFIAASSLSNMNTMSMVSSELSSINNCEELKKPTSDGAATVVNTSEADSGSPKSSENSAHTPNAGTSVDNDSQSSSDHLAPVRTHPEMNSSQSCSEDVVSRTCTVCGKGFVKQTALTHHMRIHGDKHHKCEVCAKDFYSGEHLKQHMKVHIGGKSMQCKVCGKLLFRKNSMKIHMFRHKFEKPCKRSDTKTLKTRLVYETHETIIECQAKGDDGSSDMDSGSNCCDETLKQQEDMDDPDQLTASRMSDSSVISTETTTLNNPSKIISESKPVTVTSKVAGDVQDGGRQLSSEALSATDQSIQTLFKDSSMSCPRNDDDTPDSSSKDFDGSNAVSEDESKNMSEMSPTHNCDKSTDSRTCTVCGKSFDSKPSLTHHMRIHGKRQQKCEVCGKDFYSAEHLKQHMQVHVGSKPRQCKVCGKILFRKRSMKIHMFRHKFEKPCNPEEQKTCNVYETHETIIECQTKGDDASPIVESEASEQQEKINDSDLQSDSDVSSISAPEIGMTLNDDHSEITPDDSINTKHTKPYHTSASSRNSDHQSSEVSSAVQEQQLTMSVHSSLDTTSRSESFSRNTGDGCHNDKRNADVDTSDSSSKDLKNEKDLEIPKHGMALEKPNESSCTATSVSHRSFETHETIIVCQAESDGGKSDDSRTDAEASVQLGKMDNCGLLKEDSNYVTDEPRAVNGDLNTVDVSRYSSWSEPDSTTADDDKIETTTDNDSMGQADESCICTVCVKTFHSTSAMHRHMKIHGEKSFTCEVCHKVFHSLSPLKQHMKVHTGGSLDKCSICDKHFSSPGKLKRHVAIHTGEKHYKCSHCCKQFQNSSALTSHIEKRHAVGESETSDVVGDHTVDRNTDIFQNYSCSQRDIGNADILLNQSATETESKTSTDLSLKFGHEKPSDGKIIPINIKSEPVSKDDHDSFRTVSRRDSTNTTVLCDSSISKSKNSDCEQTSSSKTVVKHVCSVCGKTYTNLSSLTHHLKRHGEKKHKCEVCTKCFHFSSSLKHHMKIHTGCNIVKCEVCFKMLSSPRKLKDHMCIHIGKMRYKCPDCGKRFIVPSALKLHRALLHSVSEPGRTHIREHPQSGNSSVDDSDHDSMHCVPCGSNEDCLDLNTEKASNTEMKPTTGTSLMSVPVITDVSSVDHIQEDIECGTNDDPDNTAKTVEKKEVKNEESCSCHVCEKTFKSHRSLNRHMKIHDESSHKCDICSKNFQSEAHLKQHMNVHTGNRQKCDVCGKLLASQSSLKSHMEIHTGSKRYTCSDCGENFIAKSELAAHRVSHGGVTCIGENDTSECASNADSESPTVAKGLYDTDDQGHRHNKFKDGKRTDHIIKPECTVSNSDICSKKPVAKNTRTPEKTETARRLSQNNVSVNFDSDCFSDALNASSRKPVLKKSPNGKMKRDLSTKATDLSSTKAANSKVTDKDSQTVELKTDSTDLSSIKSESSMSTDNIVCNKCNICGKTFSSQSAKRHHMIIHNERTFKCEICGKGFYSTSNLTQHMIVHTGGNPVKCPICNKNVSCAGKMKVHMRSHTNEKPYKCADCGKCFSVWSSLKSHRLVHGTMSIKCQYCDKVFKDPKLLSRHVLIHGERKFKCDFCGKPFKRSAHLKCHMSVHIGQKDYKCYVCDATFSDGHAFKQHMSIHTDKKDFKCDICKIEVPTFEHLREHLRSHAGSRPFKCDICGKAFTHEGTIKLHMRVHTGERPYPCQICGKSFTQISHLNTHQKVHKDKTIDCENCDRKFVSYKELESHMKTHVGFKPYHCEICKCRFFNEKSILQHKRKFCKQIVKPFKCDECECHFTTAGCLREHKKRHTKEGQFECDRCNKIFPMFDKLEKHRKSKHGVGHFVCLLCEKICETDELLVSHMNEHKTDHGFQCSKCCDVIPLLDDLKHHMKKHVKRGPKKMDRTFKCDTCNKSFSKLTDLQEHKVCDQHLDSDDSMKVTNKEAKTGQGHTSPGEKDSVTAQSVLKKNKVRESQNSGKSDNLSAKGTEEDETKNVNFSQKKTKEDRVNLDHNSSCSQQLVMDESGVKKNKKESDGEDKLSHKCQHCGQEYSKEKHLNRHIVKRHAEKAVVDSEKERHHKDRMQQNKEDFLDEVDGSPTSPKKKSFDVEEDQDRMSVEAFHDTEKELVKARKANQDPNKSVSSKDTPAVPSSKLIGASTASKLPSKNKDKKCISQSKPSRKISSDEKPSSSHSSRKDNRSVSRSHKKRHNESSRAEKQINEISELKDKEPPATSTSSCTSSKEFAPSPIKPLSLTTSTHKDVTDRKPSSSELSHHFQNDQEVPFKSKSEEVGVTSPTVKAERPISTSRSPRKDSCELRRNPPSSGMDEAKNTPSTSKIRHDEIHKTLKCEICKKRYSKLKHLQKHQKRHSSMDVSDLNKRSHLSSSVETEKESQIPEKQKKKDDIKNETTPNQNGDNKFKCDVCYKTLTTKASLHEHILIHTGEQPYMCKYCNKRYGDRRSLGVHEARHTGVRPHSCDVCGKTFYEPGSLKAHIRVHTGEQPFKCPVCGKGCSEHGGLKKHMNTHTGYKPHKCDICDRPFSELSAMRMHRQTHTDEKPFKCEQCGKCFRQESVYNIHMKLHTGDRPYKCEICDKGFVTKVYLSKHMVCHSDERNFNCDICQKAFKTAADLCQHKKTHSGVKSFRCNLCGKCFRNSSSLHVHTKTHSDEKPFKCNQCDFRCRDKRNLMNHQLTHTERTREFICEICNKGFLTKQCLQIHKRTHIDSGSCKCMVCGDRLRSLGSLKIHMRLHNNEFPYECTTCGKKFRQISNMRVHMRSHLGVKLYKCEVCGKEFSHSPTLKNHMKEHTGEQPKLYECPICHKKLRNGSLKDHMNTHSDERPFKCSLCDDAFKRQDSLRTHMRVHTGERAFECHICKKRFSQKSALVTHLRFHSGERPYECKLCGKTFTQASHLRTHEKGVHQNLRNHKCNVCGKSFNSAGYLRTHMMCHTGEKPHQCKLCKMSFSRSSSLKSHMLMHSGVKAHKCKVCGKSFTHVNTLKCHMRYHTGEKPYKCDQCDAAFPRLDSLKVHKLSHTGERPFSCEICESTFTSKACLKSHMSMHIGQSFPCDECDKTFATRSSLKSHQETHSGEVLSCDQCEKTFSGKRSLARHKSKVHSDKNGTTECHICYKVLKRYDTLNAHMKLHADKKFECEECGKKFHRECNLKAHVYLHNPEEMPYKCGTCGKKFPKAASLKKHELSHLDDLPFHCQFCEKGFAQKINMEKHIERHHEDEKVDPGDEEGDTDDEDDDEEEDWSEYDDDQDSEEKSETSDDSN